LRLQYRDQPLGEFLDVAMEPIAIYGGDLVGLTIGNGGEGLMLRQPGSLYVAGRSATLLKVKNFQDAEARVLGHEPGAGRHKGRLGALLVELPNGKRFSVGTGFSDAERENPPPIGSVINFRYQELSEGGVPRFPSYVGVRGEATFPSSPTPAVEKVSPKVSMPVRPAEPIASTGARRFTYGSGETGRFWEAAQRGNVVTMRFGALGSEGQTKTRAFPSEAVAREALEEMIADKLDDGFVEEGTAKQKTHTPTAGQQQSKPAPAAESPAPPPASTSAPAGVRHFEFVGGTSSKFWEVWVTGAQMFTRYGRIGSKGATTVKDYASEDAARLAAAKMVTEKTAKGYFEKT